MIYYFIAGIITLAILVTQCVNIIKFKESIQCLKSFFDKHIEWKKIVLKESRERLPNARLEDVFNSERTTKLSTTEVVQLVNYPEGASTETNRALHIINTYILHSWTIETDFQSIKDVVEREGRKLEKSSFNKILLPFYFGLAAFFVLLFFCVFDVIFRLDNNIMDAGILLLLPLFFGFFLSFSAYLFYRQVVAQLEENKSSFYNWIQAEMIPVSNYDVYGMMNAVSRDLKDFSVRFLECIDSLGVKMKDFGEFYALQEKTAKAIADLKLEQMAQINMAAIGELNNSVGSMTNFAKGMKELEEFLSATRELSKNLRERDRRTEYLSVIADYYKKQMMDIESRQDAIRSTVVKIDDQMQYALQMMEERTKKGMEHLQQTLLHQMDEMERMSRSTTLDEKLGNIDTALKAVSLLAPMQETMNQLGLRLRELNSGIKSLDKASQEMLQESNRVRKENERQMNRLTSELAAEHRNLMSRIFSSESNSIGKRIANMLSWIMSKISRKKKLENQHQTSNFPDFKLNKKQKKDKPYTPKNINRV